MLQEDKLLMFCALPNLDEKHAEEAVKILEKDLDWNYLVRKAAQNRIFPQTYENLNVILDNSYELKSRLPLKNMEKAYHQLMAANLILRHEARKATETLAKRRIIFAPFKGLLLDMLIYPRTITRDFSDIDLLFPNEKERIKAEKALVKCGFKKVLHPHSVYHTIMRKQLHNVNVTFELHTSLPGITHLYQYPIIEDFWNTLEEKTVEGIPLLVMPAENMVLILGLHAFREGYVRLKDVADLAAIIDSTPRFNWQKIGEYMNRLTWNYILALPLHAYASIKQSLNHEYIEDIQTTKIPFSQRIYEQSYPIPYSSLCNIIACDKKCETCLLLIQKEIPGFPDNLSSDYFVRYFPARLRLSSHFLVTYVLRDCGIRYVLKCCLNMIKALVQMPAFVLESIIHYKS